MMQMSRGAGNYGKKKEIDEGTNGNGIKKDCKVAETDR